MLRRGHLDVIGLRRTDTEQSLEYYEKLSLLFWIKVYRRIAHHDFIELRFKILVSRTWQLDWYPVPITMMGMTEACVRLRQHAGLLVPCTRL